MKTTGKRIGSLALACVLALCLAVTWPLQALAQEDDPASESASDTQQQTTAEDGTDGTDPEPAVGEITAIAPPEAITMPLGTAQEDLGLPAALAATATVPGAGGTATEQPAALPVASWACTAPVTGYDPATAGSYTFTPTLSTPPYPLAAGLEAPVLTVTLEAAPGGDSGKNTEKDTAENTEGLPPANNGGAPGAPEEQPHTVTAFDALTEEIRQQVFDMGTATLADITLPDELTGEDESGAPLTVAGVVWDCAAAADFSGGSLFETPAFDPATPGQYTFAALLPQGYTLAEGVDAPEITVSIRPMLQATASTAGPFTIALTEGGGDPQASASATAMDGDYFYDDTAGVLYIHSGTPMTIATSSTTDERIVVASGVTADITLAGVNIDTGSGGRSPFDMAGANVTLTLVGDNTLAVSQNIFYPAALHAPEGASLTITSDSAAPGSLTTTARNGAGIGGDGATSGTGEAGGTITITGGEVTAKTAWGGASIGGGFGAGIGGAGGTILITGGKVAATSFRGAGIGGGYGKLGGDGGTITITGGDVTATSEEGTGIGGGNGTDGGGDGGIITIQGTAADTIVQAGSSTYGAGIGGGGSSSGPGGSGGKITITGGTVTGGSSHGAGIGGGYGKLGGDGGTIAIQGTAADTIVQAGSSTYGAGIGGGGSFSGPGGAGGTITITGGQVAASAYHGAGIGGGGGQNNNGGAGGGIIIQGTAADTIVDAKSTEYGAGIGGGGSNSVFGTGGAGGTIVVTGGQVTATASWGAGIGGGLGRAVGGAGGTILVSGGEVAATAAYGAGIGGGFSFGTGGAGGSITIQGAGTLVQAESTEYGAGIGGGGGNLTGGTGAALVVENAQVSAKAVYANALDVGSGGVDAPGSAAPDIGGTLAVRGTGQNLARLALLDNGTNATMTQSIGACVITDASAPDSAATAGNIGGTYSQLTVVNGTATCSDPRGQESYWQTGIVRDGVTVEPTANISPASGQYIRWTGSPALTFTYNGVQSATFTMPDEALAVTAAANTLPARKSGVEAAATLALAVGDAHILDLSAIFEDADGDALTFTVRVNGAAPAAADQNYRFRPSGTEPVTFVFKANDGVMDSTDTYTVTLMGVSLTIGALPDDTAVEGKPYSKTVPVTYLNGSDTLQYSATGLPAGVGIDANTGVISGTPQAGSAGAYNVTVTVQAGALSAGKSYTLTVEAAPRQAVLEITSPGDITVKQGQALTLSLTVTYTGGGTLAYSAAGLPPGVAINAGTGVIRGTPTKAGSYPVTVTVGDGVLPDASAAFTITVTAAAPSTDPVTPTPAATYEYRTLTDPVTGVSVTGNFTPDAALTVAQNALHAEGTCAACDEIRAASGRIALFEISITGGHSGNIEVSIPVPKSYNGQKVDVWHCRADHVEKVTLTVKDGKATGTFSSLSPFAVFATGGTGGPQTGDDSNMGLWVALLCASALTLAGVGVWQFIRRRRRRRIE